MAETPTPERMRKLLIKLADSLEWDSSEEWGDRDVLHFMIGYYGIGYPNKEDSE